MKKLATVLGVSIAVFLLTGCGGRTASSVKHEQAHSSKVENSASQSASRSQSSTKTQPLWNVAKNKQLATFVHEWAGKAKLTGTFDGKTQVKFLGLNFPDAFTNSAIHLKFMNANTELDPGWATTGTSKHSFRLVAACVREPINDGGVYELYLFGISRKDNQPMVLVCNGGEGTVMYFYDVQDSRLQSAFAKIVTGKKQIVHQDSELNADAVARVKNNELPSAYARNWYYYEDGTRQVTKFKLHVGANTELALGTDTPRWLNINTKNHGVGAGQSIYVRYRYYHGVQRPTAILASGAGPFFDYNGFTTVAEARDVRNLQFADNGERRVER